MNIQIDKIDWKSIQNQLNLKGYATIDNFLNSEDCGQLRAMYNNKEIYRKTVVMERHRFGKGEYKYFDYPLPKPIAEIRTEIYPHLVKIAKNWFRVLGIPANFPETHSQLLEQCHSNNQRKPTALILKYGAGGFNALHQDLYGDVYFPFQVVLFLSDPEQEYSGGEFVMTKQLPRAQSSAIVLRPKKGDMLIFTTNFKPEKGSKGYYRARMKHGVSEVHQGERLTLGIIFHDALS